MKFCCLLGSYTPYPYKCNTFHEWLDTHLNLSGLKQYERFFLSKERTNIALEGF